MWILKDLAKSGFSGFSKIMKNGKVVSARSVVPPLTGFAWPSIYTGKEPKEHKANNFFVINKNYTLDITFYDPKRAKPFWEQLAEAGYKSLIITPPAVVKLPKSEKIDMITGFPLKQKTNSKELASLMKRYSFNEVEGIEKDIEGLHASLNQITKKLKENIRKKVKIAEYMINKHEYDLVFVCFSETDELGHFAMGKEWKRFMFPILREIDSFLAYLVKRVKEENSLLMLISDHGMQKIDYKFLITSWLIKKRFAYLKNIDIARSKKKKKGGEKLYVLRDYLLRSKLSYIYKLLPLSFKHYLMNFAEKFLVERQKEEYVKVYTSDLDMVKTKAFAFMTIDPVCEIFINDKRFVNGIVSSTDKERIKRELIRELKMAKDDKGNKIFQRVWDGKEFYSENKVSINPDIFAYARNNLTIDPIHYSETKLFMKPEAARKGDHMLYGIFGFYPKGRINVKLKDFKITEFAPIVLKYELDKE